MKTDDPDAKATTMHWDDLHVFCQVVTQGGFSAAARRMGRPVSSVSAAVARLERLLATRLLERTTRRLRLTEAGEQLHDEVAGPVAQLHQVASDALARGGRVQGLLRIAAPYEFGAHHLAGPASEAMLRYPELRIEIDVEHDAVDLFGRHYDLVFAATEAGVPPASVVARRVYSLPRALYAAPALLRLRGHPAGPEDLATWPLLAGREDRDWRFSHGQAAVVLPTNMPRMRSGNAGIRLQAALAGVGVIRVTATFAAPSVAEGRLCQVLADWQCEPLRIYALYPQRRLLPPKVKVFLDLLHEMEGRGLAGPGVIDGVVPAQGEITEPAPAPPSRRSGRPPQ